MKKFNILLPLIILFAVGCVQPKQKIEVITLGVGNNLKSVFEELFNTPEFKKRFSNVEMKVQYTSISLAMNTDSQTPPETKVDIEQISPLVLQMNSYNAWKAGFLADLSRPPFNGFELLGQEIPAPVLASVTSEEGMLLSVPIDCEPAVMYYKKSYFDDLGVDPVKHMTTLNDFMEVMERVNNDKPDQVICTLPGVIYSSLLGLNSYLFREDSPGYDREAFVKLFHIAEEYASGPLVLNFDQLKVREPVLILFSFKDKDNILFEGTQPVRREPGKWRVAPMPGFQTPGSYYSYGSWSLGINNLIEDSRKMLCWDIIRYIALDRNAQLFLYRKLGTFPVLRSLYDTTLAEESNPLFGDQKVNRIYAEIIRQAPANPVSSWTEEFHKAVDLGVSGVVKKELTPDKALEALLIVKGSR